MNFLRKLLIFTFLLFLTPLASWSQEELSAEEELDSTYADISDRMLLFQDELRQLAVLSRFRMDIDLQMPLNKNLLDVISGRLRSLTISLNTFSTRWTAYSQAQQVYIADNDSLLEKMAEIQQQQQMVSDTLASRQQLYDHLVAFSNAETFIWHQDATYRKLYKQATTYSLSPKLAGKLEKVKAEEQALSADVEKNYSEAKAAADAFPGLKVRMKGMENKVFQLQSVSAKIQEMAYKPFIQRVKDYLIGIAAVAILLMFVNLLNGKIKTLKAMREQAKKLKESMNGQHNYPTI